jgi:hypothetical protein
VAYVELEELQSLLGLEGASAEQLAGLQRALDEAAQEIDWELGYTPELPAPDPVPPLVAGVNLDRAVEHWRQQYSPFGVMPFGGETTPVVTARNSWNRHALKLQPLKVHAGIA